MTLVSATVGYGVICSTTEMDNEEMSHLGLEIISIDNETMFIHKSIDGFFGGVTHDEQTFKEDIRTYCDCQEVLDDTLQANRVKVYHLTNGSYRQPACHQIIMDLFEDQMIPDHYLVIDTRTP